MSITCLFFSYGSIGFYEQSFSGRKYVWGYLNTCRSTTSVYKPIVQVFTSVEWDKKKKDEEHKLGTFLLFAIIVQRI